MGWCDGSDIYDIFIHVLINLKGASDLHKFKYVVRALQDNDWDCEDDFLDKQNKKIYQKAIVEVLKEQGWWEDK